MTYENSLQRVLTFKQKNHIIVTMKQELKQKGENKMDYSVYQRGLLIAGFINSELAYDYAKTLLIEQVNDNNSVCIEIYHNEKFSEKDKKYMELKYEITS